MQLKHKPLHIKSHGRGLIDPQVTAWDTKTGLWGTTAVFRIVSERLNICVDPTARLSPLKMRDIKYILKNKTFNSTSYLVRKMKAFLVPKRSERFEIGWQALRGPSAALAMQWTPAAGAWCRCLVSVPEDKQPLQIMWFSSGQDWRLSISNTVSHNLVTCNLGRRTVLWGESWNSEACETGSSCARCPTAQILSPRTHCLPSSLISCMLLCCFLISLVSPVRLLILDASFLLT